MANHRLRRTRIRVAHAVVAAFAWLAPAAFTAALPGETPAMSAADAGGRLFAGVTRFANRGPPCAECHDVAGLPFPHGGSMGPELTGAYAKYGPDAIDTVLATLYFPTMSPIFANRLLTPQERIDLKAFLERAGALRAAPAATGSLAIIAIAGALVLLGAAGFAWRGRLRGVRRGIVAAAARGRGARP